MVRLFWPPLGASSGRGGVEWRPFDKHIGIPGIAAQDAEAAANRSDWMENGEAR